MIREFTQDGGRPSPQRSRTLGRGGGSIVSDSAGKKHTLRLDMGVSPTGRRVQKWKVFNGSLRDARAELARLISEVKSGAIANAGATTVAKHFDEWVEWLRTENLEHQTFARYESIVRAFIQPELGNLRLDRLSSRHVDHAIAAWRKKKRRDGRKGALSERTVHHAFAILKAGLNKAVDWDLIAKNPVGGAKAPSPKKAKIVALDEVQAAQLLNGLHENAIAPDLYAPAVLILTCGLRRGECLGLAWSAVDLDRGIVRVERSLEFIKRKRADGSTILEPHFKSPKSETSRRSIAMSPIAIEALKAHRREQLEHVLRLGRPEGYNRHDLVFPAPTGDPWVPDRFTVRFARSIRRLGLPIVTIHGLRHTYATLLLRSGTNLNVAKVALGHSTIGITADTYSHILFDQQEAAADRLGAYLGAAFAGLRATTASGE